MTLNEKLKNFRIMLDTTIGCVSELTGLSENTIEMVEDGEAEAKKFLYIAIAATLSLYAATQGKVDFCGYGQQLLLEIIWGEEDESQS